MIIATFNGEQDLIKAFGALSAELRQSGLEETLIEAAEPIRAQMAEKAPRGDEAPHIAENIAIQPLKKLQGVALMPGAAA